MSIHYKEFMRVILLSLLAGVTAFLVLDFLFPYHPEKPPAVNCEDHPLPEAVK